MPARLIPENVADDQIKIAIVEYFQCSVRVVRGNDMVFMAEGHLKLASNVGIVIDDQNI